MKIASADPGEVGTGGKAIYTYRLENRGKFDLTDIILSDDRFGIVAKGIGRSKFRIAYQNLLDT